MWKKRSISSNSTSTRPSCSNRSVVHFPCWNPGRPAVLIATPLRTWREIKRQARAQGFDFTAVRERQQLVMLDAGEALAKIMDRGQPQRSRSGDRRIRHRRCPAPLSRVVVFAEARGVAVERRPAGRALESRNCGNKFRQAPERSPCSARIRCRTAAAEAHQIPFEGICACHNAGDFPRRVTSPCRAGSA